MLVNMCLPSVTWGTVVLQMICGDKTPHNSLINTESLFHSNADLNSCQATFSSFQEIFLYFVWIHACVEDIFMLAK